MLRAWLPADGTVLEIGAGTGEHAVYFAGQFPRLIWRPTDHDPEGLASIDAWRAEAGLSNLCPARFLDVGDPAWPASVETGIDAIVAINVVHIAPWSACQGLMAGAATVLGNKGVLVLYGPFTIGGRHTAPSNAAFDAGLRRMDSRYGVRDLEAVADEARAHGLERRSTVAMPANNISVLFRRRQTLA